MRASALLVILLVAAPLAGCLELEAARIPDKLLEGQGGNGWAKNASASQKSPTSTQGGFVKTQALVYEDKQSTEGFPGSLSVTTLRTLLRPSEETLIETVKDRVRAEAEAKGIRINGGPVEGTRELANRAESFWFTYNGTVTKATFFTQQANIRIFGEVSQCSTQKTVVVLVGLAQVTDVRSLGGVILPSDPDPTTWREIIADPRGKVEGVRGSEGLAYNVVC